MGTGRTRRPGALDALTRLRAGDKRGALLSQMKYIGKTKSNAMIDTPAKLNLKKIGSKLSATKITAAKAKAKSKTLIKPRVAKPMSVPRPGSPMSAVKKPAVTPRFVPTRVGTMRPSL